MPACVSQAVQNSVHIVGEFLNAVFDRLTDIFKIAGADGIPHGSADFSADMSVFSVMHGFLRKTRCAILCTDGQYFILL